MYGALDISTSGLIAQRTRMEAISANIANQETFTDKSGRNVPFARRVVYFAAGSPDASSASGQAMGVHATVGKESRSAPRYDPENPLANSEGYVNYPDINSTQEMMNMYEASRAYEANLVAAEATKTMVAQALRLLA